MPIYEYRCQSCGHEVEILQKLNDPLATECPACKAQALKKKVSAAGFRLKGGGWYETDFKSGNKKNVVGDKTDSAGDKNGGGAKKSTEAGDKAKTETKSTDAKSSGDSTKPSGGGSKAGT